jgi:hypothetical protein
MKKETPMLLKMKRKLLRWLKARPPKVGAGTIKVVAGDLRKMGLGAMSAGLVAVFNPTGSFTIAGAAFLFGVGFAIWAVAVVLHALAERVKPKE